MTHPSSAQSQWDAAIERLADLLDHVEEAIETGDWDLIDWEQLDRLGMDQPPLPPPDAATAERARAVLADAGDLGARLTSARAAVESELAAGGDRRTAASRYRTAGRLPSLR